MLIGLNNSTTAKNATDVPISCFTGNGDGITDFDLCFGLFLALLLSGLASVVINVAILQASRYASAGQNSTLVFIRSLCVGDMIIGLFGILKACHLAFGLDLSINIFLSESFFFTATTAIALCHVWLSLDTSFKLAMPLVEKLTLEKNNVIALMVFLWNCSFIMGFLPQLGWSYVDYSRNFFLFYDWRYLLCIASVWEIAYFLVLILQVYTAVVFRRIRDSRSIMTSDTQEFKRCRNLVMTSRLDLILWLLFYIPPFAFIGLYCSICTYRDKTRETYILWIYVVWLWKSLLNGITHGYRTPQIRAVFGDLVKKVHTGLCHPSHIFTARSRRFALGDVPVGSISSAVSVLTVTSSLPDSDGFDRIEVTPL